MAKCNQLKLLVILIFFLYHLPAWSACEVLTSRGKFAEPAADPLSQLLFSKQDCPADVFQLRHLLKASGFHLETTMVANRGFHNPAFGSFSLFEMVLGQSKVNGNTLHPGEFFFGHFTAVSKEGYLTPAQKPIEKILMIEAFAWDNEKKMFNFYELRGNGKQGQWFYRGDSADIFADNEFLHRQSDPAHPQFGDRLRCSACHGNGGPIMKELEFPHNDWWRSERKLDLGGRKPDARLSEILQTLVPADQLAQSVKMGMKKLFEQQQSQRSLPEQLRPLFCPVELNLQSDSHPNEEQRVEIAIPAAFFVDTRLLSSADNKPVLISRRAYEQALLSTDSHFPETNDQDGDHAWLTPVKATSDQLAIKALIKTKIIDDKFAADVLSIDMFNPVFSQARCHLLRFLPNTNTANWREIFINNLSQSKNPIAKQLAHNLNDTTHTPDFYQQKVKRFLTQCRIKLQNATQVRKMYELLVQRRAEIAASEISANPLGKILEPGFRVIFPETGIDAMPGKLQLTEACEVV